MRRRLFLLLPGLSLAGCAAHGLFAPATPAGRHAAAVREADAAIGQTLDHLAARERAEVEQAASLRYAAGTAVPRSFPPPAVPLAGAVLDPGMDIILLQANRLAALAAGIAYTEGPDGPAAMSRLQYALAALRGAPGRWPNAALVQRGLEGFRSLAAPAPAGSDAARLAADRQPAIAAAVALLAAVIGEDMRSGLRGVLAQRHDAWREAQRGILVAAQRDRNIGPERRMAMWNQVQAQLAADGPDLPAAEMVRLLAALPAAHAAAGAGDLAVLASFEADVDRLEAVLAQAQTS